MTADALKAELSLELASVRQVIGELQALAEDLASRQPTIREKTAGAAFLAQFYSGIEKILKRLARFHGVELPSGENWHVELFRSFCTPSKAPLPALFDEELARQLGAFRRFRHVVHHGYGFEIEWDRMREGVQQAPHVLALFTERLETHLKTL